MTLFHVVRMPCNQEKKTERIRGMSVLGTVALWGRRRKADCAIWNCWWMRITIARSESAAKYGGECMDRWLTPLPLLFFLRQATFPNYAKVTYGRGGRLDLFASPSSSPTRRGFTFLNWFPPSPQAMHPFPCNPGLCRYSVCL